MFVIGGAKGCDNTASYQSTHKNGRSNKLEHNAPPQADDEVNEEGNNDSLDRELLSFSCEDSIQKEDEQFRSYYEDSFNHFGAFLLYYQQKIQADGWQKSQAELKGHTETHYIDNYAPNQYCGMPPVGALKKAVESSVILA